MSSFRRAQLRTRDDIDSIFSPLGLKYIMRYVSSNAHSNLVDIRSVPTRALRPLLGDNARLGLLVLLTLYSTSGSARLPVTAVY